jgi:hypothetical protein
VVVQVVRATAPVVVAVEAVELVVIGAVRHLLLHQGLL